MPYPLITINDKTMHFKAVNAVSNTVSVHESVHWELDSRWLNAESFPCLIQKQIQKLNFVEQHPLLSFLGFYRRQLIFMYVHCKNLGIFTRNFQQPFLAKSCRLLFQGPCIHRWCHSMVLINICSEFRMNKLLISLWEADMEKKCLKSRM